MVGLPDSAHSSQLSQQAHFSLLLHVQVHEEKAQTDFGRVLAHCQEAAERKTPLPTEQLSPPGSPSSLRLCSPRSGRTIAQGRTRTYFLSVRSLR